MDSLLRKIESNEVVVYTDQVYSAEVLNKCREIHKKLILVLRSLVLIFR